MEMKERIKRIQEFLGVEADGLIGPATITAAERRIGLLPKPPRRGAPPEVPEGNHLQVSKAAIDAIVFFEVSSEAFYNQRLQRPTWPGAASGVTIGIGYDLGHTPRSEIEADWKGLIGDTDLLRLKGLQGIKGEDAKGATRGVRDIKVPFEAARTVFATKTLPRYAERTRRTWPGVEKLPADAQGALLSLVFNRGTKLTGSTRTEMAAIKPLVAAADLNGIAGEILAMRRLWPNLRGLLKRREREAELVKGSRRSYKPEELVLI